MVDSVSTFSADDFRPIIIEMTRHLVNVQINAGTMGQAEASMAIRQSTAEFDEMIRHEREQACDLGLALMASEYNGGRTAVNPYEKKDV